MGDKNPKKAPKPKKKVEKVNNNLHSENSTGTFGNSKKG